MNIICYLLFVFAGLGQWNVNIYKAFNCHFCFLLHSTPLSLGSLSVISFILKSFRIFITICIITDEILSYIRNLEDRVRLLEAGSEYPLSKTFSPLSSPPPLKPAAVTANIEAEAGSRPESVTNAMKVLEVHEQILEKCLDSDETSDDLGDGEKALVREMCNVS